MQSPMGMAAGGRVPTMPRHAMQAMGLPMYDDGGQVMPVMLSGRHGTRPGYAHGGLVQAAKSVKGAGRLGDSVLVHVNPKEFKEMEAKFGPHSVNPETGLPEFGWFGDLLKIVAPIALMAIPGLGTAVGSAILGTGAAGASTLGSALLGAGVGGITGGWKGALAGGLTGGIGANLPASIGGLSSGVTRGLEGALLGAGSSAITGGNPLTGALMGGATGYLGNALAGKSAAPAAAAETPYTDAVGVVHNGAPSLGSIQSSPLESANGALSSPMGGVSMPQAPGATSAPTAPGNPGSTGGGFSLSSALPALALLAAAGGKGGAPATTTSGPPTPNLPDSFKQPFEATPYAPEIDPEVLKMIMQNPNQYATHGGGGFYKPGTAGFSFATPVKMAHGGALSHAAKHVSAASPAARAGIIKGSGDGQSDDIDAKLAKDEHVLDSEFVAQLGNGSSDAGHEKIERWKADVRRKKRAAPAGKIPPKTGAIAASFAAAQRKKK